MSSAHFRALCSSPQQRKTCPSSLAAPHLHSAPPPVSLLLGPRAFLGMESVLSSYLDSAEVPGILPSQVTPSADKGWGLVHTHLSGPLSQDGSGVCRSHSSEGPSRAEPQPPMAVTSPVSASHPHLPRDLIPAPRDPSQINCQPNSCLRACLTGTRTKIYRNIKRGSIVKCSILTLRVISCGIFQGAVRSFIPTLSFKLLLSKANFIISLR